jgi:RHS repeat-associated protein
VPFGEVFIEERNNTWNTPYLFNAKELDEETGLYYYGARYYDARISLWLSTDPLQEKYPNVSTYAYCVQNPVKFVDPTGEDYTVTFQRDSEGNLTGLTISAQIYITGANASTERAGDLNKMAKSIFKSQKIDGITVSFEVNYEYRESISSKDLATGENILDFTNTESTIDHRSHIEGSRRGNLHLTGNTGEIYKNGTNGTVMHETGHLIGLADRYEESYYQGRTVFETHPGYEKDLMSSGKNIRLDKSHYKHYIDEYGTASPSLKVANGKIEIGRTALGGWLRTPYEKGGKRAYNAYKK